MIQTKMFPEYPPNFYAYEMEAMGDRWWEVYLDMEDDIFASVEPDDFGDWIDNARSMGYNTFINTYESWEALDECK